MKTAAVRASAPILLLLCPVVCALAAEPRIAAPEPASDGTNSFPPLFEVFQGRTFTSESQRDLFFLQAIHSRYPEYWPSLLEANITLHDYVEAPAKLLRFIGELGDAMRGRDDRAACTNLARVTADENFYANTNVYRPEILQAAARALLALGPEGESTLAAAISRHHYQLDPDSLEQMARVIGEARPQGVALLDVLEATAFDFSTTNGATYPSCTREAVRNLLNLDPGAARVRKRLTVKASLEDPGRFQAVLDGIDAAAAGPLQPNLAALEQGIRKRFSELVPGPSGYRDDLQALDERVQQKLRSAPAAVTLPLRVEKN